MPTSPTQAARRARRWVRLASLLAALVIVSCDRPQVTIHPPDITLIPPAKLNTVTLVADAWPPYNNDVDDDLEGYLVDFAKAALEPHGYQVRYLVVPWERALEGTRTGLFDGAIAPSHEEGPELVFPKTVLFRTQAAFFVRADSDWRFEQDPELESVTLGVIQGYDYGEWLTGHVAEHGEDPTRVQALTGESALEENILKLLAGRVDAIVDNEHTIVYTAMRMGVAERISLAGVAPGGSDCYIAFSPEDPRAPTLAALLDIEFEAMKNDGRLDEILRPYGLLDDHGDGQSGPNI